MSLSGHGVRVRPLDPDADADPLREALDHDDVWCHLAGRAHDTASFAAVLRSRASAGWHQWCVLDDGGRVVGTSSYLEVSVHDARLEVGATAYARAVWGSHVNPACKLLLLGYAFDDLRAGRVQLKTDVRNVRSQQAIARLGARPEGVLRRYQRREDGTVRDTVVFSVTAEDWPDVRAGLLARLTSG
ncbi:GNAT family N-acetyltransferase [Aquipuribacter nitratireducens]|uniref:GNAT family N-acetyltransferase n=1 Tax=Aquipuribacter nitratireducens TaxID=650104 RepID=A0ABW0GLF8_9MICO